MGAAIAMKPKSQRTSLRTLLYRLVRSSIVGETSKSKPETESRQTQSQLSEAIEPIEPTEAQPNEPTDNYEVKAWSTRKAFGFTISLRPDEDNFVDDSNLSGPGSSDELRPGLPASAGSVSSDAAGPSSPPVHRPGPSPKSDNGLSAGLDSLMPAVLFLIFNRFWGLAWAIGAATAWSLKVVFTRKRKNIPLGKLFPIVAGFVLARGIIGIVTDSEAIYFGIGIASKFAIGLGVAVSAMIGRNVLAIAAPYVFEFPEKVKNHAVYKSALDRIAYAAAVYYTLSASFDIWLYNNNSVEGYIIIRLIVNWPLGLVVFWGCVAYLVYRLRQVPEFPGLYKLLEQRAEVVEQAWAQRRLERRLRKVEKRYKKYARDSESGAP